MKNLSALLLTAGLLASALPSLAHHAFAAEYDATKQVELRGVVTDMEWINPHAWIHIDVKGADGKITSWMVEGGSPNILLRRGFNRDSLPKGTEVVILGYRAKDGANRANGGSISLPDGRKLFLGSSGTGSPVDTTGPDQSKGK
ncbi:MAG: DUF6152 family protein [Acidobacteriota bacterium]